MYSLNCNYNNAMFPTLIKLMEYVMESGMDPNCEIMYNGKGTGEYAIDLIQM